MVSVQVGDVPVQPPVDAVGYVAVLQPANVPPLAGVAVKVTIVPAANFAPQVPDELLFTTLQLIPAGVLTMLPLAPLGLSAML